MSECAKGAVGAAAIVLAAGAGTRMKSKRPKVAYEVLGRPLVRWVVEAAREAGIERLVTVVGHLREQVEPLVADTQAVVQPDRNGTADAVAVCADVLAGFDGSVVVLSGDCPLITAETIGALVAAREEGDCACVVLTMDMADPFGYGRIMRGADGGVERIVEQKDATPEEAAVTECNSGFYCFDAKALFEGLAQVGNDNAQGEFYLTDVLEICRRAGRKVAALRAADPAECLGVNSRAQLAQAQALMRDRINGRHLAAGVTLYDPATTWIGPDVQLAADVAVLPNTMLMGATTVGEDSVIGPNTRLTDTVVGAGCAVDETVAVQAVLDDGATAGPRAYLRPGAHLSYIGDATVGSGVNIGAGSITCNYDGQAKHATVIGDGAFIGSDTMMVAPVSIGERAVVAAGSCITRDVSPDALGVARSRQTEVEGWAAKHQAASKG